MIVTIPLKSNITDGGIEFMSAFDQALLDLAAMKCWPTEVHDATFDTKAKKVFPGEVLCSFSRIDDHAANMRLYVPDEHPSAVMVKLTWGGI